MDFDVMFEEFVPEGMAWYEVFDGPMMEEFEASLGEMVESPEYIAWYNTAAMDL